MHTYVSTFAFACGDQTEREIEHISPEIYCIFVDLIVFVCITTNNDIMWLPTIPYFVGNILHDRRLSGEGSARRNRPGDGRRWRTRSTDVVAIGSPGRTHRRVGHQSRRYVTIAQIELCWASLNSGGRLFVLTIGFAKLACRAHIILVNIAYSECVLM